MKFPLFVRATLFAGGYGLLFYVLQVFFVKTSALTHLPGTENLALWDVGFYDSIRAGGYDGNSKNVGFFPLFSYLWRITQLGIRGACALNILLFAVGFGILMDALKEESPTFWLLCLVLPSTYFAFLPYTEAIFFLLIACMFWGIRRQKNGVVWIAVFAVSFVRATAFFVVPAMVAMALFGAPAAQWTRSLRHALVWYLMPTILGLAIFIGFQYQQTGIWFAYFKIQSTHWGHVFSWPTLPLRNIEGGEVRYHWLSATALFLEALAGSWLLRQAFLWLRGKVVKDPLVTLTLGYMFMALLSITFLNPHYGNVTNVMGANRYLFITPFFFFYLHHYSQRGFSLKEIGLVLLVAGGFMALFGAYVTLIQFVIIGLLPLLLIAAFLLQTRLKPTENWLRIVLIAFCFMAQMHLFQQFIGGQYVD